MPNPSGQLGTPDSGAGSLSPGRPSAPQGAFGAAVTARATVVGTLTVGVALTGQVTARGGSAATGVRDIRTSAHPTGTLGTTGSRLGSLSLGRPLPQVPLLFRAGGQATATGALTINPALTGQVGAKGGASGGLTNVFRHTTATAQAGASATLIFYAQVAGAAGGRASASASLSINLGPAVASSQPYHFAWPTIRLAALSAASAAASGAPTALIQLSGSARGQADAAIGPPTVYQPFTGVASVFATGGADPYVTSSLGVHYSGLGIANFQLGGSPTPHPTLLASARIYTQWATMGRVTQIADEVAEVAFPAARVSLAALESAGPWRSDVSGVRVDQAAVEAAAQAAGRAQVTQAASETLGAIPSPGDLTQFAYEVASSDPPPAVPITQFALEVLAFIPPYVQAKASILVASRNQIPYGNAWLRVRGIAEHERVANAAIRVTWPPLPAPGPLPNPTLPPTVVVVPSGGTLQPGTYQVVYTWHDAYGETLASPPTTVTITVAGSSLRITFPEDPPPGGVTTQVYITAVDGTLAAAGPPIDNASIVPPSYTTVTSRPLPIEGALPTPSANTTGYSGEALDHEFRDPVSPLSQGTIGWRPHLPGTVVVVRSGEQDVAVLNDPADPTRPLTNPLVTNTAPPMDNPVKTFIEEGNDDLVGPWPARNGVGAIQPLPGGDMELGTYQLGYTLIDAQGRESAVSPRRWGPWGKPINDEVTLVIGEGSITLQADFLTEFQAGGPPSYANGPAVGFHIYMSRANGSASTMYRQTTAPLPLPNPAWTKTTVLNIDAPTAPFTSAWPEASPPADGGGLPWYDPDYTPTVDDTVNEAGWDLGWTHPFGGFPSGSAPYPLFNQVHGIASYNPHWRALPSAPIVTDPNMVIPLRGMREPAWGSRDWQGVRLYFRHTWTQPPGAVAQDALLTLRFNGVLDHVYVNGTEVLHTSSTAHYWWTAEVLVPKELLVTGSNLLAIQCHPTDVNEEQAAMANPTGTNPGGGGTVHVPTGPATPEQPVVNLVDNTTEMIGAPLPNGSLLARRPDSSSRQYWDLATFEATGRGFHDPEDRGPGYWGYWGFAHNPQYWLDATWTGNSPTGHNVTPGGERLVMWGHGWSWPPVEGGFGAGDLFRQGAITDLRGDQVAPDPNVGFELGDDGFRAFANRWSVPFEPIPSLPGVWRIGGGGNTQLTALYLSSSDEWSPGVSYLMSYSISGGEGTTERTAFNGMVRVDGSTPVAKIPNHGGLWEDPKDIRGAVVATVPVAQLQQVFITAVSRSPTIHNLGKSRMYVFALDANDQRIGRLSSDNEYLAATFGEQPATLWPYSENLFWTGTLAVGGAGAWRSATKLQVVIYQHADNPTRFNEWLINITVREGGVVTHPTHFAALVG